MGLEIKCRFTAAIQQACEDYNSTATATAYMDGSCFARVGTFMNYYPAVDACAAFNYANLLVHGRLAIVSNNKALMARLNLVSNKFPSMLFSCDMMGSNFFICHLLKNKAV